MKSKPYDFVAFIGTVGDKDYYDLIYLAEQEATRAERCFYHPDCGSYDSQTEIRTYADNLKRFIRFMRYGLKPRGLDPKLLKQIQHLRQRAFDTRQHPSA
jgi:hypothetical protein